MITTAVTVVRTALVAAALVACGPSSQQIATARDARYNTDPATIFEHAQAAAQANYHKIGEADPVKGAFITLGKWYSADGQSQSAGVGDTVLVDDGSLYVQLLVQVGRESEGGPVVVIVTPVVERFRMGVAQREKLRPDDPSLPGWVHGKADALTLAIYERAKQYAAPATTPAAPAPAQ
jgi:hypothetical protein